MLKSFREMDQQLVVIYCGILSDNDLEALTIPTDI